VPDSAPVVTAHDPDGAARPTPSQSRPPSRADAYSAGSGDLRDGSQDIVTVTEIRHRWEPTDPIPEGWRRGNQVFVGEFLEVFVYDPAVPYSERKKDGSTDRWIKFRKVNERRYVTKWEADDA
jgi:hypothetical protein